MYYIVKYVFGFIRYYFREDDRSWQGLKDNGTAYKSEYEAMEAATLYGLEDFETEK